MVLEIVKLMQIVLVMEISAIASIHIGKQEQLWVKALGSWRDC